MKIKRLSSSCRLEYRAHLFSKTTAYDLPAGGVVSISEHTRGMGGGAGLYLEMGSMKVGEE